MQKKPIIQKMLDERIQEIQNKFQSEVLDSIIKSDHLNGSYFGHPDKEDHRFLSLCSCNRHYYESDYYIKDDTKFIHFSSRKKLRSILNSSEIRMNNLSVQNDKEEFKFAATLLGENPEASDYMRRQKYSLSMCRMEVENDLTMWRLYGENTKGVGIVIEIQNNPIYWMDFHLSQIYYGQTDKIIEYKTNKAKFEKENNFEFILSLERFLGFHKSKQYSVEKEVRLIYIYKERKQLFSILPPLVDVDSLPEYVTIPLNLKGSNNDDVETCILQKPIIRIKEIILGPNFQDEELLSEINNKYDNIAVRQSHLGDIYKV